MEVVGGKGFGGVCKVLMRVSFIVQEMSDAPFYSDEDKKEDSESDSDEEDESEEESRGDKKRKSRKKPYVMDPDHRLLLRNSKPLLQSRSAAVSCFFLQISPITLLIT